ncbi:MAG TPA: MaoC/PaaZ C-terminal domain-containing protein [Nocardioides sp.]|nr:MaoC/PaaZ C-terminal domain-containing protein [Nocardioides sp.]
MPIDAAVALSAPPVTTPISWSERDVLLYHLSLGAGRGTDPELGLTYERDLAVLPTYAVVAGQGISAGPIPAAGLSLPGIDVDLRRVLHSGQDVAVHAPIPTAGTATLSSRVTEVWDKGSAALVVRESTATSPEGEALWTGRMAMWLRGEGGFGGEPGPVDPVAHPVGAPDRVLVLSTTPDQALLYRLNGDLNPLHVDPEIAGAMGFARPILHGLATYGMLAHAIVRDLLGGDPARLTSLGARFAGAVLPGDRLRVEVWCEPGGTTLRLHTTTADGRVVLSHGTAEVV